MKNFRLSRRLLAFSLLALVGIIVPSLYASDGARRDGDRFLNSSGSGHGDAGVRVTLPFFARRIWSSLFHRPGAATRVPFDAATLSAPEPTITWVGHATMLVRMSGAVILTDPMFSNYASPVALIGPKRHQKPGVELEQLPRVDLVTLSHNHYDHTDLDSIRALAKKGARFVVPLGLGEMVRNAGGEAIELDWWQSTTVGKLSVTCIPAQHFSRRGLFDGDETLWSGWVIKDGERSFYHAGDTAYFDVFAEVAKRLGPIDLVAMPIGAYEPSAMMRPVHVDPEEAVQAALDVGARITVAMHYGTFDLADEPMDEPPRRFRAEATRKGLSEDRAWVLDIGESRPW